MKEFDITGFDITGAERIGIPKGDDRQPCVEAFEAVTGIEVPTFKDRKLSAMSQGIEFFLLKGRDIPGLAGAGLIDLGATGTDSYEVNVLNGQTNTSNLRYKIIGDAMCRLDLMAEEDKKESVELRLKALDSNTVMPVVTPLPQVVNMFAAVLDLPIQAVELPPGVTVSGSMEAMPRLLKKLGVELVADRVESGQTARDNGLVEIMPIEDIYPALVQQGAS